MEKDRSVSVHKGNIQILATDMYKIKKNLSLLTVTDVFEQRNEQHYDLRINCQFTICPIWTVYHGSRSISFLGLKIWIILPDSLKNANRIEAFKMQIKKWTPENYPCRLSKVYFQNVSFVQRYTNANLKISLYVCVQIKSKSWKLCILNPKGSWVICPWSL